MGTLHEEEEKSLWWWFSCTLSVAPKRVWRKLMWFSSKLIWVNLGWLAIGVESYCSKSCLHTQLGGPVVVVIPCSKSWNHFLGTERCDHLCFPKHSRVGGPWWAFNMWATGMLQLSEGEEFGFLIVSTHFWHFCSVNALKAMSTFPLVFMGSRGETPLSEKADVEGSALLFATGVCLPPLYLACTETNIYAGTCATLSS